MLQIFSYNVLEDGSNIFLDMYVSVNEYAYFYVICCIRHIYSVVLRVGHLKTLELCLLWHIHIYS